jgi:hypothetical protein
MDTMLRRFGLPQQTKLAHGERVSRVPALLRHLVLKLCVVMLA